MLRQALRDEGEAAADLPHLQDAQGHLDGTIKAITPVLYRRYVKRIYELIGPDEEMAEFPDARYVMDVTLQEIWTPLGTYEERKRYFSGKHKAYGLKTQTLHNRRGFLVHCVPGIEGAVHDLTIGRQHMAEVRPYFFSVLLGPRSIPSSTASYRVMRRKSMMRNGTSSSTLGTRAWSG